MMDFGTEKIFSGERKMGMGDEKKNFN